MITTNKPKNQGPKAKVTVILKMKTTDVKSLKRLNRFNDFTSVVLISNMTLFILSFAIKLLARLNIFLKQQ